MTAAFPPPVEAFFSSIEDAQRALDARALCALMEQATGEQPAMWGASIVGFGSYAYRYESGRTGESMLVGFSPRKDATTLYLHDGLTAAGDSIQQLGKVKTGKGCLYFKRFADVDAARLADIVASSAALMRKADVG
jgi:hypothetical protein